MENTNDIIIQEYSGMLAQANHNTVLGIAHIKELEQENKELKDLVDKLKESNPELFEAKESENERVMEVEELEG